MFLISSYIIVNAIYDRIFLSFILILKIYNSVCVLFLHYYCNKGYNLVFESWISQSKVIFTGKEVQHNSA